MKINTNKRWWGSKNIFRAAVLWNISLSFPCYVFQGFRRHNYLLIHQSVNVLHPYFNNLLDIIRILKERFCHILIFCLTSWNVEFNKYFVLKCCATLVNFWTAYSLKRYWKIRRICTWDSRVSFRKLDLARVAYVWHVRSTLTNLTTQQTHRAA